MQSTHHAKASWCQFVSKAWWWWEYKHFVPKVLWREIISQAFTCLNSSNHSRHWPLSEYFSLAVLKRTLFEILSWNELSLLWTHQVVWKNHGNLAKLIEFMVNSSSYLENLHRVCFWCSWGCYEFTLILMEALNYTVLSLLCCICSQDLHDYIFVLFNPLICLVPDITINALSVDVEELFDHDWTDEWRL